MHREGTSRKRAAHAFATKKAEADASWNILVNDKLRVIQHAMSVSGSTIKPHRLLILVDLQGMYLALHKWLSERAVPVEDGLILGRFARLQIERSAKEITRRLVASHPGPAGDLGHLFQSVSIDYVDGRPHLGQQLHVIEGGTYLHVSTSFELFYAPVPLKTIEWRLMQFANWGSSQAKEQLRKAKLGIVSKKGAFERDYKAYDDFVSYLKQSTKCATSQEGFFGYSVGPDGLKYFDEKEVDIRIAIRAMDALHNREADAICIVSSDQDFLPLHERARDFGVTSFQADLAKFSATNNVGSKLKDLGEGFIQGGIDPSWPLEVLTEAMSSPDIGHFADHNLSEAELHALCRLHNDLNEVQVELNVESEGAISMTLHRPCR